MIYLDHHATTPLSPLARQAWLEHSFLPWNVSSSHRLGQEAAGLIQQWLRAWAATLKCDAQDLLVTGSATEAINTYFWDFQTRNKEGVIFTSSCEHAAVLQAIGRMPQEKWSVEKIPLTIGGEIDLERFEELLIRPSGSKTQRTRLVALMAANNETGVLHPIQEIATIASQVGAEVFVDAVALAGRGTLPEHPAITGMAISPHKFHGPTGIGLLMRRAHRHQGANAPRLMPWTPLIVGGKQQRGGRAGSLSVPLLAAATAAWQEATSSLATTIIHLQELRDYFERELQTHLDVSINGSGPRVASVSNVCFTKVDGEALLIALDQQGVMASHGSACQAGLRQLSHVLTSTYGAERARSSLRFSFAKTTTREEVTAALEIIIDAARSQLRWLNG